ncbi:MAG TPA: polysaccharide deacetylase family protein [Candidatus Acidoferrales bacterium]|nr:polysaccharide deacetylase family protein [Candidatus Acidoferrales bacterium]
MQLRANLKACSPAAEEAGLSEDRAWRARSVAKQPVVSLELPAKRRIAKALCGSASAAWRRFERAKPGAFRALILHDVAEERLASVERLVQFLLAEQRIMAPADVRSPLAGPACAGSRAPCLLTFDDGFLSQYRIACDILDPHGVKAVFFICPILIDLAEQNDYAPIAKSLGYAGDVKIGPLMGWRQVKALAENGHTIGAHSQTHRSLINLPMELLEDEVVSCANRLERAVPAPVEWFAYPFGDIGNIDERALRCVASRYTYCCSGIRGLNTASTPPFAMLREHLELHGPFSYLQLILDGALDWRYLLARRRLRRMVGEALSQGND